MAENTPLKPCPFCEKAVMPRWALWPSDGDRDAIIHTEPTDCPMAEFSNGTADKSIVEDWNRRASTQDAETIQALRDALTEARTQVQILQDRLGIKDTGCGTLSIVDAALSASQRETAL